MQTEICYLTNINCFLSSMTFLIGIIWKQIFDILKEKEQLRYTEWDTEDYWLRVLDLKIALHG